MKNDDSFSKQIDDVLSGKYNRFDALKVCDTPRIFLDAGLQQLPILYTQNHLKDALHEKSADNPHWHGLSIEQIKKVPKLLESPVLLMDSLNNDDSIVAVLSLLDNDNAPVFATIKPNGNGIYNSHKTDSNFMLSIYGKEKGFEYYIKRAAEENKILYWNKEKSQEIQCAELLMAQGLDSLDSNKILHQTNSLVNKTISTLVIDSNQAARIKAAREIKENMPNLSENERAAAIAILEAGAKSQRMSISEYMEKTFPNGIFGDIKKAENSAKQQGIEINGAVSINGFGENAKAVIYASKTADFSTWCHELSHIWQSQLTGELKQNAEEAFQVKNSDWQNSIYTFEDGHADTSAEAFAYGFEDFLKHKAGEMATEDKKAIFEKFADYMSRTYNGVKQNIKINEEIAKVYEKFLQLDDNILAEAEKAVRLEIEQEQKINKIFNSPNLKTSQKVSEIKIPRVESFQTRSHSNLNNITDAKNVNISFQPVDSSMLFQSAYHGSSANFEKFNTSEYGMSGDGAMAFGYGVYVSNSETIARSYAGIQGERNLYSVEIPDGDYIVWDKKISNSQKEKVKNELYENLIKEDYKGVEKQISAELDNVFSEELDGKNLYGTVSSYIGSDKETSRFFKNIGYSGIQYPAGTPENAINYVIFDDNDITIKDHFQFQTLEKKETSELNHEKQPKIETSNQLQEKPMENQNIEPSKTEFSNYDSQEYLQNKLTTQMILDQEDREQMEAISATMKSATKDFMDLNATPITEIPFTKENYDKLFPFGIVQTPVEKVKLGEHQFEKLDTKDRGRFLLASYQTLATPDIVIEEVKEGKHSHNYIKSFVFDEKTKTIQDIVVNIDGENISISAHPRDVNNVLNKIKTPDQLVYAAAEVGRMIEQRVQNELEIVNPTRADRLSTISVPLNKEYSMENALSTINAMENSTNAAENSNPHYQETEERIDFLKTPTGNKSELSENEWKFSHSSEFKELYGDWEGKIKKDFLLSDDTVSQLTGNEFGRKEGFTLTEQVEQYFNEMNNSVESPFFGKVVLDKNGADDSLSHGMGRLKAVAYAGVPDVIKKGVIIDSDSNHKDRSYNSYVIAAPIKIADKNYICEVVLKQNKQENRFYLHEVTEQKKFLERAFVTNSAQKPAHQGTLSNILEKTVSVNYEISCPMSINGEPEKIFVQNEYRKSLNEFQSKNQNTAIKNSGSVKQEENPFKNADPEQIKELYEQAEAVEKMQQEAAYNTAVLDENSNPQYQTDEEFLQEYKQKYPESSLDISEDTKNELENVFSQIDDYLDKGIVPEERRFTLPKTPLYLKELGSNETAISIPVSVIKKAKETHGLSNDEIKNSLTRLFDPVAVFDTDKTKSENKLDSKLILTDEFSESKPIALALNINTQIQVQENGHRKFIEVQDIRSIHDRTLTAKNGTDLIKQWTENGLCRYVDDKKISEWSTVARVYFPIEALQSDKNNILTKSEVVNPQNSDSVKQEENPSLQMEPGLIKKFNEMKKAIESREKQESQTAAEKTESAGSRKAENHEKPKVDLIKKAAKDFISAIKNGTAPFLNSTEKDFGKISLRPAAIVNASNGLPFSGEAQLLAQIYYQQQKMEGEIVTTFEGAKESGTFIANKPESKKNFVLANKTEQQQKEIIQKTRYFMPEACDEPDKIYAHALQKQRPQKISDYRDLIRHFENIPNGQKEISDLRIRIAHEHLKEIQSRFAMKKERILTVDEINERKKILQDYFKNLPEKHRESEKNAFENTFGLTLNPEEIFKTNLEGNFKNKKFEDVVKSNEKLTDQANRKLSSFIQKNSMEDKKLSEILHEEYNAQSKEEKETSKKLKIEAIGISEPETYLGKYLAACNVNAEFVTDEDTIKAVQSNLVKKLEENYRVEKYGILKEIGQQAQRISNETTSKIAFDKAHSNKNTKEKKIEKEIGPIGMGN